MSRKVLGLFVMGLMLFSLAVVPSVKPVAAADSDSVLKTVIYSSSGALFMGVWNPSSSGYSDTYSGGLPTLSSTAASPMELMVSRTRITATLLTTSPM